MSNPRWPSDVPHRDGWVGFWPGCVCSYVCRFYHWILEMDERVCPEKRILLPQNKLLPERIVGKGVFGKRFEDSIKFILHGFS